ncbi:MAG: UDP-N-acetylmuramate dehydrogenase [Actinomycetota bacterium]|nr:UDP-N-acetylmuramate dehydrogenase [Actinomycetota bacterium]
MARHTTYRVGGPAALHVTCDTVSDLSSAVHILNAEEIPWVVLGKGSNILVADQGYEGAVIVLGREFKEQETSDDLIRAGAATILAGVVNDAFTHGFSGYEFLVGIPGTVGGALAMNAGAREGWIGDVVESVTLYVPGEGLVAVRGEDIEWGYRDSGLSARGIIVESTLRALTGDKDAIRATMEESFRRRKETQPVGQPCAGSVFVNPDGVSAGRLIESAGLKGTRVGGAVVSARHANFIVNEGGAKASDVFDLIRFVQDRVNDLNGIELRTEIKFLGSFE